MGNEARRILAQKPDHFRNYPGGSLQYLLDMVFDTPFSRLVEESETPDTAPAKKKAKRVRAKKAKK